MYSGGGVPVVPTGCWQVGVAAVEALRKGNHGVMVGVRNRKVEFTDFEQATKRNPEMDEELMRVANIISI